MKSCSLLAVFSLAAVASAQPRIVNGKLQVRPAAADLGSTIHAFVSAQTRPAWIGYAAPSVAGERNMCCYGPGGGGCTLTDGKSFAQSSTRASGPVRLEPSKDFHVLMRADNGALTDVRPLSGDCELDIEDTTLGRLSNVSEASSLKFLATLVTLDQPQPERGCKRNRVRDGAVAAISLHSSPLADTLLESYVKAGAPDSLRRHAAFWIGQTRGSRGVALLTRIMREETSETVRGGALHGLALSREPGADKSLIDAARSDKSAHLRGQALFWLAQRAGKWATSEISSAIENDPELRVKEQAVFALTQLPRDEGVPLLIDIARNNRNPGEEEGYVLAGSVQGSPRAEVL
jgi:hypothetical protein